MNAQDAAWDNSNLEIVDVLNVRQATLGIPSAWFVVGLVLSLLFLWVMPWTLGWLPTLLVLLPLYLVHKDDPQGLETLIDSLQRPLRYEAGLAEPLHLVLVQERSQSFEFDDPRLSIREAVSQ